MTTSTSTDVANSTSDCPSCGGVALPARSSFVYALGRIVPKISNVSLQMEVNRVISARDSEKTKGKTTDQVLYEILCEREYRYVARQICYVLTIEGIETFVVQARDALDIDQLIKSIEPNNPPGDVDVVIGFLGPMASPEHCGNRVLPILAFDRIYSFQKSFFIGSIPKPAEAVDFEEGVTLLLDRVMQIADNTGIEPEHRAMNFLVLTRPELYSKVHELQNNNIILTGLEAVRSRLPGGDIFDVILSFTNRNNEFTEKWFWRVDVNGEFPFIVTKMSQYFDR